MSRRSDINALLDVADELLRSIRAEYEQSLHDKAVSPKLAVQIKNYLENLRSALDYAAREIYENILLESKSRKVYFPISCENKKAFETHMVKNLPGLDALNAPLYHVLGDIQSYNPSGRRALPKLSKLVNQNKHNRLSPQTRTESKSLDINFPGGARISMGPGTFMSGRGLITSGSGKVSLEGDPISGNSPARATDGGVTQSVSTWVSFKFDETGDDVISLLTACLDDVRVIFQRVEPFLWKVPS